MSQNTCDTNTMKELGLWTFLYTLLVRPAKRIVARHSKIEIEIPGGYSVCKPVVFSPCKDSYQILIEVHKK